MAQDSEPRFKPLMDRVDDLENEIFGTREGGYRDGIKPKLAEQANALFNLRRQITFWGAALVAVVIASGTLNGKGGEAIGALLKMLTGG